MAQSLDINTITYYTGCKRRTIERILLDFRKTGSVARQHLGKGSLKGRTRAMQRQDVRVRLHSSAFFIFLCCHVQFLQGLVRHSPDAYLDEMQELLEMHRGVDVGKATVWRALIRSGFTMKKARFFSVLPSTNIETYIDTSSLEMHWSEARPSALSTAINMVPTLLPDRLFLSTKAPSTAELLFVERHGHYRGNVQYEILSLFEGGGKI